MLWRELNCGREHFSEFFSQALAASRSAFAKRICRIGEIASAIVAGCMPVLPRFVDKYCPNLIRRLIPGSSKTKPRRMRIADSSKSGKPLSQWPNPEDSIGKGRFVELNEYPAESEFSPGDVAESHAHSFDFPPASTQFDLITDATHNLESNVMGPGICKTVHIEQLAEHKGRV